LRAARTRAGVSGSSRICTPIASNTAFAIAGAVGLIGGSASPFAPTWFATGSDPAVELALRQLRVHDAAAIVRRHNPNHPHPTGQPIHFD